MTALMKESRGNFDSLRQKLLRLGVHRESDLNVILSRFRVGPGIGRGEDILAAGTSPKHSTVLLEGIACLYEHLSDGSRQIYSFRYPGDFCDLSRYALRATTTNVAIAAVTDCRIGVVENHLLEQMIVQIPSLGLALWRSTCLEAAALQASARGARQTALQRVAHLLSEQLARQASAGIEDPIIRVSQIDLADATGLSIVHVCRTFKVLQGLGILSKVGRSMGVVDRERLAALAAFDGSYLCLLSDVLSKWQMELPGDAST